jgi:SAM-dependent methyltransferase
MAARTTAQAFWDELSQFYKTLGPPTKPTHEDLLFIRSALDDWTARHPRQKLHALLLGVTPAIAEMQWPRGSRLLAVDNSIDMINALWRRDIPGEKSALCADWRTLPLPEKSADVIVGDGMTNCFRYPEELCEFTRNARRILSEDGMLVLRPFLQPEERESPEAVLAGLEACPGFYHFLVRLMMALQHCPQRGVPFREIYEFWLEHDLSDRVMAAHPDWRKIDIDTVRYFNVPDALHTFTTLSELQSVLLEAFENISVLTPSYPLGERFPTLVVRP